jgi:hypothetical protein
MSFCKPFGRIAWSAPFGLFMLSACGGEAAGPCARASRETIIFYDQSASSVLDAATAAMFRDTLAGLVESALECNGDAVHGFLVHANTRGKVNRIAVVNGIAPPDTLGKTTINAARASARYKKAIAAFHDEARTRLLAFPGTRVDVQYRRNTDMLGTLEVISGQLAQADSASRARIYYFGDMHESMVAPRRNFDARPPKDRAEAEAWADADTALLREMTIDRARFPAAEVRIHLGSLAHKPRSQEVRMYWERLFRNVGFEPTNIRYN